MVWAEEHVRTGALLCVCVRGLTQTRVFGQRPAGGARRASWSKHSLNLTVGSDPVIQRKSTLNLNVSTEIEDAVYFRTVRVGRQSLYSLLSTAVKTKQEGKDR